MVDKKDLLIEVGTEELPPQALLRLSEAFQGQFRLRLQDNGLGFKNIERFATPRRLALRITSLDTAQSDQTQVRKGPSANAAFDDKGNPTKAAEGFARSCGVGVRELKLEESERGAWLVYHITKPGSSTEDLIPTMVKEALDSLPIPKRMRWGDLNSEFVRPVHWVVLLFGNDSIEAEILDVVSGRETRGHRFHHPQPIVIKSPCEYDELLREKGYVEADFDKRKERIRELTERVAEASGAKALIDPVLLDEVTALSEWPVAVMGSFEKEFLEVPAEVLIETMQKHQKYFPVIDNNGALLPKFITISNIESLDQSQVRAGNERVIRPRFKDAAFFWEQDLKRPLGDLTQALDKVIFQHQLGTLGDKTKRVKILAVEIAEKIGLDKEEALRSAELAKCDLLTDMVGEFASLQGTMGRYYALAAGESECVANSLEEQYLPRHAGDSLPRSLCGQAIAVADRLDSLLGIFAIGQKPSGVKDPYAIRRSSLGVMRILIETPLDLDIKALLRISAETLADRVDAENSIEEVYEYMLERLKGYYADMGFPGDVIDSVLMTKPTVPVEIDERIKAVAEFKNMAESSSLSGANKRIKNILKKVDYKIPDEIDKNILQEKSEIHLFFEIVSIKTEIEPLLSNKDYSNALRRLATLKNAVDDFFDNVMVLCEDEEIRLNRLALLNTLFVLFQEIADISRLN